MICLGGWWYYFDMKLWLKRIGYGVGLWAVLYAAAIPLLSLNTADPIAFKATMAFLGSSIGAITAALYFLSVERDFLRESIQTAVVWMVVNWLLDYVALLPFTGETLSQYFMHIGIEYLGMFGVLVAIGYVLEKKIRTEA